MDLLTKIQAQFLLARERGIPPYYRTTRGAATFQGSSSPPPTLTSGDKQKHPQ